MSRLEVDSLYSVFYQDPQQETVSFDDDGLHYILTLFIIKCNLRFPKQTAFFHICRLELER